MSQQSSSSSELSYQDPEDLTTIDEIDEDIQNKYPKVDWKKPQIKADTYGRPLVIDTYRSVDTSLHHYDCLIHAFLTDVSPNFRALSKAEKDQYADWFRRKMFINFFDASTEAAARAEVAGVNVFLGEPHIQKLIDIFQINIIVFEKTGSGIRTSVNLGGTDDILEDEQFILIYNPGDAHFRGVRDMSTNTYMFDYDDGYAIAEKYAVGKDASLPRACPFVEGEDVIHEGQVKKIFEIVWEDARKGATQMNCIGVRFLKDGPIVLLQDISKKPKNVPVSAPAVPLPAVAAPPKQIPTPPPPPALPPPKSQVIVKGKSVPRPQAAPAPVEEPPKSKVVIKGKTAPLQKQEEAVVPPPSAPRPSFDLPTTKEGLLKDWREKVQRSDFDYRNELIKKMKADKIFPEEDESTLEKAAGLYPDVSDPNFVKKLMEKREFAESKQPSIKDQIRDGVNPCDPDQEFEISPVQRFVSRLLNPYTPYTSALLYHGVGVGKTCAAITIAEGYLEKNPRDQVYIVAPPNIQPGFERTIFDFDGLKIGKGIGESEMDSEMNTAKGCTGNTYLKLTGTLFEQDRKVIESRVKGLIRRRYKLMGYTQFANEIEALENSVPRKGGVDEINKKLREKYSGKVLIIDEAHNLRDIPDEGEEENLDAPGGVTELSDAAAGKKLTPFLRHVLTVAEGLTLVLLTGTPMYNSYSEIIFLLNLLLMNEKRGESLTKDKIFESNGSFRTGGEKVLGDVAGRYVSFMRGENPLTFPIRLKPLPGKDLKILTNWPTKAPNGSQIESEGTLPTVSEIQRANRFELPLVECYFQGENASDYKAYTERVAAGGLGIQNANALVQAGNWIFPGDEGEPIEYRIRNEGFENTFEAKTEAKQITFRSRTGKPTWLAEDQIATVSPKTEVLLKRLRTCNGCAFVYSRFVKSGALSIALALEANGYTPWGRERGFLADGIQAPGGLQCARCPLKREAHAGADHKFVAAKYVLLTGSEEYSPNNPLAIATQRRKENMFGEQIKVVVGSQVVSEGIDLRYIREIYVFDSWFHLNKLEQVIGRGIRTCSHALIPDPKLRNCTVYMLVNAFRPDPDGKTRETMDIYTYRRAIRKAVEVGRVTRVLKEYAIDCNLNHDAILVTGIAEKVQVIDGQGNKDVEGPVKIREASLNDTPFTALCDWEECDTYKCIPEIPVDPRKANEQTYTEFAAKWQEQKLLNRVRLLFQKKAGKDRQAFVTYPDFVDSFHDISEKARNMLIQSIIKSKSFYISLGGRRGRIIYKNGYFLFQPLEVMDESIPLALRIASYPVKRDSYIPEDVEGLPQVAKPARVVPEGVKKPEVKVQEEEPVEKSEVVEDFWTAISEWSTSIRNKDAVTSGIPPAVSTSVNVFFGRDEKLFRRSSERLGMISWLYESVKENDTYRSQLAEILQEIVWDEFLNPMQQLKLFLVWKSNPSDLQKYNHILSEHFVQEGGVVAFRFVDPRTGALRYFCGEKECSDLQKSVLEESESNRLKSVPITASTTGFLYGFLVPKKGDLIYKNVAPPGPGAKVEKGQECSISSQVSDHLRKLRELGAAFKTEKATDLDLNEEKLTGARKFENAVRACFLMDLVMRLMDRQMISRKRWFYKSISAKLAGHKGTFEKGMEAKANT